MTGQGAPGVEPRPLRVHVLGGFSIEGYDEKELGTRKARLLLKRLAVEPNKPVATDELSEAIWGEDRPQRPSDQVSVLISRLRAVLGTERIPRTDAGYTLAADWFDIVELDHRARDIEERLRAGELGAALAAAQACLALSAGTLLPEEDADWVSERRPHADRLLANARLHSAEAALASGEFPAARAAAQAALDQDPYDESALRLLMQAHTLSGNPASALSAYATTRHRLAEDLGVDPSPETEQVHGAILRGELQPPEPAWRPTQLVGRDLEIKALDEHLAHAAQGHPNAVVIEAEAGLGKTALLSAWLPNAATKAVLIAGRCDELGGDLPLQPIIDGLEAHLDSIGREAARELLAGEDQVLAPLLRTTTVTATQATKVTDQDQGRSILFAALATVLQRAAADRTIVVVVDDLHQAAAGTAEFLTYAQKRIAKLLVIATIRPEPGPDLPNSQRIRLSTLSVDHATELYGHDLGPSLHERSGGHPLFMRELAAAGEEQLPDSIVASIRAQIAKMRDSEATLEAAASCGTDIDAELIASVTARPIASVLDDLERAMRVGLLKPRGTSLAFNHELIREAIETSTSPVRRHATHSRAVAILALNPEADPLGLARHARRGGDVSVAATGLIAAAKRASERYESTTAEQHLDEAIALHDSAPARLLRGRIRLSRLDLDAAREDVKAALDLGARVEGFELAGWIEYYGRDYDAALRYADEGVERSDNDELKASCLALSGRIRHTRGELREAAKNFEQGVAIAPPGVRGMVQIWQGQLLSHQGDALGAAETARRGLLDPQLTHPFAGFHGRMTVGYALGLAGQWNAALDVVEDIDKLAERLQDKRFPAVAANYRGWLLRGAGLAEQTIDIHRSALPAPGPTFQESHYAGLLDIVDCYLALDDQARAADALEDARAVNEWIGSMFWAHRSRFRLLQNRLLSREGDHEAAEEDATALAASAAERGSLRHELRAKIIAATAAARRGHKIEFGELIEAYQPLRGPDGWRDLAELAHAAHNDEIWKAAEDHAASIVAQASSRPGLDKDVIERAVRQQLDRFRP